MIKKEEIKKMDMKSKYPEAYAKVMQGNLRYYFDNLSIQMQEEVLLEIEMNR